MRNKSSFYRGTLLHPVRLDLITLLEPMGFRRVSVIKRDEAYKNRQIAERAEESLFFIRVL